LAPIFYRDADGAVLVFDLTIKESFEKVIKWYKELQQYVEGIRVILVGNKRDKGDQQVDIEEAKKLARGLGVSYISVSAKEGKGVDDIFSLLAVGK
jgi:Ras-related protein Rab-21